jgi:hypothetical protein
VKKSSPGFLEESIPVITGRRASESEACLHAADSNKSNKKYSDRFMKVVSGLAGVKKHKKAALYKAMHCLF